MSGDKVTGSCNKFQPNIFNKSKCQNCFKSREVHPLNDSDLEQAKPIYAGWLCLAPVGTDFDNPMQRSRKWQRRFFILYEHGSLTYALDELPSTLPQGTVNMNLCANITDAEPRTGQRNALCIVAPQQEIFIRGDNKEIINGWSEQLTVYLWTNKQNQKKKRKVDPVANQDPSPAKMAATGQSCPASEAGPADSHRWQEELHAAGPDVTPVWTVTNTDPPGPEWTPAGDVPSLPCSASMGCLTSDEAERLASSPDLAAAEPIGAQTSVKGQNQSRDRSLDCSAEQLLGSECTRRAVRDGAAVSRQGRPDARTAARQKLLSTGDGSLLSVPPPQRRAKSLDRRISDTAMTPDLLNFKKGWMMKLDEDDEWKKYWFVLSTASLRYYKDSVAEESSDLEGEIDLTKCYSVSEYRVQRNYGFQIHTQKAVHTLSAMTTGIRKNWIQALMKNVHPANAPDVANLPGHYTTCSPAEVIPKPDVTQDSAPSNVPAIKDHASKPRSVTERRHEGCSKTFDWSGFSSADADRPGRRPLSSLELGDLERRRRREERRRRYESLLGFSLGRGEMQKTEGGAVQALSPKSQQEMTEKLAECWRQVEKTALRPERMVMLSAEARGSLELEKLLQGCRKMVDDLKAQLADSERRRLHLEAHLSAARFCLEQDLPGLSEADVNLKPLKDLNDSDRLCRELLQQQQDSHPKPLLVPQPSGIWMHDIDGDSRNGLLLAAPALASQQEASPVDGPVAGSSCDSHHQNQQDREGFQLFHGAEPEFLVREKPEKRDDIPENHVATDQSVMKRLSQEVELLTSQNQALNQRNQEMVNQLTEADREIERLKVELGSRYTEPHHLPEVEQQEKMKLEDMEKRLSRRNQELLEAQVLIASLEENLREAEAMLQLKHAAETDGSGEDESKKSAEKTELLQRLDATEAKLTELQRQLEQSELTCTHLEQRNTELKETGEVYLQKAAEAEAVIRRLTEEKPEGTDRNRIVPAGEKIQQVIEGAATRLQVLGKLLELIESLDFTKDTEEEEESAAVRSQLRWEETFWKSLLNKVKDDLSDLKEPLGELLCEVMEGLMLEQQLVLAGHELLLHPQEMRGRGTESCESKALKDVNSIWEPESASASESRREEQNGRVGLHDPLKKLKAVTQTKLSSLKLLASSGSSSALDRLLPAADTLHGFYSSHHPAHVSFIHSAATEAFCCCFFRRLQSQYQRRICSNCVNLKEETEVLKTRLSALEEQSAFDGAKMSTSCQTDERCHQFTDTELQRSARGDAEETPDMELTEDETLLTGQQKISDKGLEGSEGEDPDMETQQTSDLRAKVEELEEQLKLKEDFDQKMRCVQEQHEREIAKLKATCERGLVAIEDCHQRVVEELQRLHQQEVERLLVERERLLEEESAATATAIEAIKNAHRAELQREIQRRCRSEKANGNTQLEEICRQHREELASFQRELDVLSQQFSLKCLENGHLVQAVEAERKALCQCQQENQDLRSRNQELSGHLAAEITRLCSLAKQDQLPLGHTMDAYEMEITLRVKESEVQSLKQEVSSLKDELQAAVKDKRNATKKYKDVHSELSIIRAKAEQEAEELRENLRLAHRALGEASP